MAFHVLRDSVRARPAPSQSTKEAEEERNAPEFAHRSFMKFDCADQNAAAFSSPGSVFAKRLTELPSNELTPNRAHIRILISEFTRPTWQYAPRSPARSAHSPIVSNFHEGHPSCDVCRYGKHTGSPSPPEPRERLDRSLKFRLSLDRLDEPQER